MAYHHLCISLSVLRREKKLRREVCQLAKKFWKWGVQHVCFVTQKIGSGNRMSIVIWIVVIKFVFLLTFWVKANNRAPNNIAKILATNGTPVLPEFWFNYQKNGEVYNVTNRNKPKFCKTPITINWMAMSFGDLRLAV
ncbi:hypothetical protein DAI22_03g274150 [Oryza sativa Japonica Group]|nr:hypothetical protein DAI22_03g274150 [Oryza sativa Japonica Group]